MAKPKPLRVGTLVARIEAPTMLYRVSEKFPDYARALPFQRSGREVFLMSMKVGGRMHWIGDGSQWTLEGEAR